MKRKCIILLFLLTPFLVKAQIQKEYYSEKGDEAIRMLDYSAAKMWFQEIVSVICDPHSISQLTFIWLADDSMRIQLDRGNISVRCLSCLDELVRKNFRDTATINMLITYYTHGIGTEKDEDMAAYWKGRLDDIKSPPAISPRPDRTKPPIEKTKMDFFAGYSANLLAPYGVIVGGVGRSVGWYLRFRSNLSFQNFSHLYKDKEVAGLGNGFAQYLDKRIINTWTGTGGIIIKADPSFLISFGAGYCSHEVIYQFQKIGAIEAVPVGVFWAKDVSNSFYNVALDLDGIFKLGKQVYGSIGCSLFNIEQVKVYANAGIIIFF